MTLRRGFRSSCVADGLGILEPQATTTSTNYDGGRVPRGWALPHLASNSWANSIVSCPSARFVVDSILVSVKGYARKPTEQSSIGLRIWAEQTQITARVRAAPHPRAVLCQTS